jgi:hypothetical protein
MGLIKQFGEMWARNPENLKAVLKNSKRAEGVYILYDGSTPVYIGKGNIRDRLKKATKSKRRKDFWDHFSWYVITNESLRHDVEVLLLRTLPPYLRNLTRQKGKFTSGHSADQHPMNLTAEYIARKKS